MSAPAAPPHNGYTAHEYDALRKAYDWFNADLFGGGLPGCLITLQRSGGAMGYFAADMFEARRGAARTAEIALNPDTFRGRTDRDILSTLVHEMVHLWQACHGDPGRGRYHNREWAGKMREVGLAPSDTGRPGGKETGDQMTHYILPGGRFADSCRRLLAGGFRLRWQSTPRAAVGRNKLTYACPGCDARVWGHDRHAGRLLCLPCDQVFVPVRRRR
jgi:hypothetical protein